MVVIARADLLYSVNGRLRSFSELTALVNSTAGWTDGRAGAPRISSEMQDKWKMPTTAIVLRKAGGPVDENDYLLGRKTTRIDTFCYGATGKAADDVWAMLDAILVPAAGQHAASFRLNGCRIDNIVPEADALAQTEPDSGWSRVFCPYLVYWWSLP